MELTDVAELLNGMMVLLNWQSQLVLSALSQLEGRPDGKRPAPGPQRARRTRRSRTASD